MSDVLNMVRACVMALGLAGTATCAFSAPSTTAPSVALHYGAQAPLDDLKVFDIVVVDPDHGHSPQAYRGQESELYAYAAVTEVHPSRAYFKQLPTQWHLGRNAAWDSVLIDQSQPDWPNFFAERVIAPLWDKGFRGFFLDTLDSYRLAAKFDEQQQQDGVVAVLEKLHRQFPGIKLILNRGFEVLPRVKDKVQMVAAESLFQSWDPKGKQYTSVKPEDREWLLQQLRTARDQLGIPALVIDYVPPQDRAQTRETARQIQALGFTPWVSDPKLQTIGVGSVEFVPRRIAVLYNGDEYPALNYSAAHRFLDMPINYLGYISEYHDIRTPLPDFLYGDRYAGVVTWFGGDIPEAAQHRLQRWLSRVIQQKLPWASMGQFGFDLPLAWSKSLGILLKKPSSGLLQLVQKDAIVGFEVSAFPADRGPYSIELSGSANPSTPLVTMQDNTGGLYSAGAITAWGGFIHTPYVVQSVPGTQQSRWAIDPFAFLQKSLRLQPLPVPDVTTENGRRLLLAHIDGDAFPSKAEMPGNRFAADWLLTDILQKYRIPHTVSVIEAEVSPQGLYPQYSTQLESIAKRIFALPHVEIASHTYSHPFLWDQTVSHGQFAENKEAAINLGIPGYEIDLHREIVGSVAYIRERLSGGKPVNILLWSGDTAPGADALEITSKNGLLNMNGGDTFITRSNPSLTAVMGHGISKKGYLQVYAPITNENIYTNLWHGPFYGFERVLETFAMTESPRRLKAVDIYYHTYAASKQASLNALHKVYDWALQQPLHPVFASEYIRKVQDFYTAALARDGDGWRIRTRGDLRTVRIPQSWGTVDLTHSLGIAGNKSAGTDSYVHMTGNAALLHTSTAAPALPISLSEANARLTEWKSQPDQVQFQQGHAALDFSLAMQRPCEVRVNDRVVKPTSISDVSGILIQRFRLSHAAAHIQARCTRS
jgi:peptidoglycan/xylan/chitin deacetylase (PgdA/CDA1 family)